MAEQQLPDINGYVNSLPIDADKQDKLFDAFYSDNPKAALEAIQDVPKEIRQSLLTIRGKIYKGEQYDLNDIINSAKSTKAPTVETAKGLGERELKPEELSKEAAQLRKEATQRRAMEEVATVPKPSEPKKTSATPFEKKKEEELDFFGRPKEKPGPKLVPPIPRFEPTEEKKTAPPPTVKPTVEKKEAAVPGTELTGLPGVGLPSLPGYSETSRRLREEGLIFKPKAKPSEEQDGKETGVWDSIKGKAAEVVAALTQGEKPEVPSSPKLAQAKAVAKPEEVKDTGKPLEAADYSIGARIAKDHPTWFEPIAKKIDPTKLTATETYEAWKDMGTKLMARALGVPEGKVKTDISNILGAQFLDEAAKTAPELFDFMSSPGGLGYIAAGLTVGKVKAVKPIFNAMVATDLGAMFADELKVAVENPTERNIAKAAKALGFLVLGVKDQLMPKEPPQVKKADVTPGLEPPTDEAEFEVVGKEAPKPAEKAVSPEAKAIEPSKPQLVPAKTTELTVSKPTSVEIQPPVTATAIPPVVKATAELPAVEAKPIEGVTTAEVKGLEVTDPFSGSSTTVQVPSSVAAKYETLTDLQKETAAGNFLALASTPLEDISGGIRSIKNDLKELDKNPAAVAGLDPYFTSAEDFKSFTNEIIIPYLEHLKASSPSTGLTTEPAPTEPTATPPPPAMAPTAPEPQTAPVPAAQPAPATTAAQVAHPKLNDQGQPVIINSPSEPTPDTTWTDPATTAVFVPEGSAPIKIGDTELKPWTPPQDGWSSISGVNEKLDNRKPFTPTPGKQAASGVIIVEDDGRVWLISPTNQFGGYDNTLPKGKLDPSLSMQENAIKEAWEETGLKVDIIGIVGDYEKSTSKVRYYLAKRVGGTPKNMGWEAQAVKLATLDDAKNLLNQQVDKDIISDLEKMVSSGKLAEIKDGIPRKLSTYGQEVSAKIGGSNPGGWYQDSGTKWLIKGNKQKVIGAVTPEQSDARAANEVLASKLLRAVNKIAAPEMKLVDLEGKYGGGLGVASKKVPSFESFNPNNPDHVNAAAKTFAINAWLANYDVLGMGYDNTVITPNGNAINIDPGGALLFRAQGLPKGASHGVVNGLLDPSAPEFESMQKTTPEQKAVFGKMTPEQLKDSAKPLATISDETIKKLVNTYGWGSDSDKAALADNLIQRKNAILQKAGVTTTSSVAPVAQPSPQATPQPPVQAVSTQTTPPPAQTWKFQLTGPGFTAEIDAPAVVIDSYDSLSVDQKHKASEDIKNQIFMIVGKPEYTWSAQYKPSDSIKVTAISKMMGDDVDDMVSQYLAYLHDDLVGKSPLEQISILSEIGKKFNPSTQSPQAVSPTIPPAGATNPIVGSPATATVQPSQMVDLNTSQGTFSIPQKFLDKYNQMTQDNKNSFVKVINKVADSRTSTGSSAASMGYVQDQIDIATQKIAEYDQKINSGTATTFDKDRKKYYSELVKPYLEYILSSGKISKKTGYVAPSGTALASVSAVPPRPQWVEAYKAQSKGIVTKGEVSNEDALYSYSFLVAMFGKSSSAAKKASTVLKNAQKKNGDIPAPVIDQAIEEAKQKYSQYQPFLQVIDKKWTVPISQYFIEKKPEDQFKFPYAGTVSSVPISDVDSGKKSKFDAAQSVVISKLNKTQKDTLIKYTGNLAATVNSALGEHFNSGYSISDSTKAKIKTLDAAFKKAKLGENVKLVRNIGSRFFWKWFGMDENGIADHSLDLLKGKSYTEITYVSTSMNPDSTICLQDKSKGRIKLIINAGKNFHGIKVSSFSQIPSENEVILARGTTYVIREIKHTNSGASPSSNVWEVFVDIVDQTPGEIK